MSSFKKADALQWSLEESLDTATVSKKAGVSLEEVFALPLPIQAGDRVVLGDTGILVPIRKIVNGGGVAPTTFEDLLVSIEQGLAERLLPKADETIQATYKAIGKFKYGEDRICHIRKFEAGKLKAKHILGEAIFFHGGLRRSDSTGVWTYRVSTD